MSLWVYVWWDLYKFLPIDLLHTNWTIVAPLFYSLRFSVSLPAYINLQRSCRKASCSSSRESHIIFKAVTMNIQTICLPPQSYCSFLLITQMSKIISGTRSTISKKKKIYSPELRRLVPMSPNKQLSFSWEGSFFFFSFFLFFFSVMSPPKHFTHIIYNLTCVWLPTSYYRYGQENCSIYTFLQRV